MAYPPLEDVVLEAIVASPNPVGARKARAALVLAGREVSEATVSRMLQRLDASGLTLSADGKGRVATASGRQRVVAVPGGAADEGLGDATGVRSLDDLLKLLAARRGVEREAARGAARAHERDVRLLRSLIDQQRTHIEDGVGPRQLAMEFHLTVARMSGNKLIASMSELLFSEHLDRVESILDAVVGRNHSEARSLGEHERIVSAIDAGDADAAEAAMVGHLDRLIGETEKYATPEHVELVDRVIAWALANPVPIK